MRGVEGLEDIGARGRAIDFKALGCGSDKRGFVPQRLQQAQDAVAVLRRAHQHRTDDPVAQLLGKVVEHLVARRRHVLKQLLHQLVVIVGELLQHGEPRLLLAVGERLGNADHFARRMLAIDKSTLEREIDEAGDDVVLPDRHLAQHERLGRGRLQHGHDVADARLGLVDLVDEQEMGNAAILELLEDQLERRNLLFVWLAHHDGGVASRERVGGVGLKFDRARAIEEGVAVAEEIDGGHVELDAHAVMPGFLRGVADGVLGRHGALPADGAGAGKDGFEKCRLTAEIGANQCDAAGAAGWLALRLAHTLLPWSFPREGPTTVPRGLVNLSCQGMRPLARGPIWFTEV